MKKTKWCHMLCSICMLGFLLGVRDGKIALWKDGKSAPWRIFPYPVSVLPQDTQQQLKAGIRIDSMEDLDRVLENLLS